MESIDTDAQALGDPLMSELRPIPGDLAPEQIAKLIEEVWEPDADDAQEHVRELLRFIGEDPEREGLQNTPERFVKALGEWFGGYHESPAAILSTFFEDVGGYDEVVMLKRIPFSSHCEHHIAPIIGTATVAYIPDDRVIGISKLARLVDCFARRLQVQERLTTQIADAIEEHIRPKGVAVIINAVHHCMLTRGVNKDGSDMVTSVMRGVFLDDSDARKEVLALHLR